MSGRPSPSPRRGPCSPTLALLLALPMIILVMFLARSGPESPATVHGTDPTAAVIAGPPPGDHPQPTQNSIATSSSSSSISSSGSVCGTATRCVDCLLRVSRRGPVPLVVSRADTCVWCAATARCIPTSAAATCPDVEDLACPAVLIETPPQTHRVIHVAIRKGGPEALVQLHLALNHWGFRTTLDTRHSKKQKGGPVVPFFLSMYRREFAAAPPLRYVRDYADWHATAADGDVLIATETWECKSDRSQYLPRGVRQLQWHLTVWPRRPREECTIVGHTRYVAATYMRQSQRALLFPYISPHILALADEKARLPGGLRARKRPLVLYDSDTKLRDADLSSPRTTHETKIATGYTPEQLYALYDAARCGIDLRLPGGERFIYEAVLFDVCVIVDRTLNGGDDSDFPIPPRFKIDSADNRTALVAAKDDCLLHYDEVIDQFAPLKALVRRQRDTFYRHVRRYFSESVHIVTTVASTAEAAHVVPFLLATLLQVPFAVVEVIFASDDVRRAVGAKPLEALRSNSFMAAVIFRVAPPLKADASGGPAKAADDVTAAVSHMLSAGPPQTSAKRTLFTWLVPLRTFVAGGGDAVHVLASALRALQQGPPEASPAGLLLVNAPLSAGDMLREGTDATSLLAAPPLALFWRTDATQRVLAALQKALPTAGTALSAKTLMPLIVPLPARVSSAQDGAPLVELVLPAADVLRSHGAEESTAASATAAFLRQHELWRTLVASP